VAKEVYLKRLDETVIVIDLWLPKMPSPVMEQMLFREVPFFIAKAVCTGCKEVVNIAGGMAVK
jgi:hypothetical protein